VLKDFSVTLVLAKCSFICQGTSTRRERIELLGLESSCHLFCYLSHHSKVEASR